MIGLLAAAALGLAACSGGSGSGSASSSLNPFKWFGGGRTGPKTLDPKGGFPTETTDSRPAVAQITGAKWEPIYEGAMLVVTAVPRTKGWWALELIPEEAMPKGRIHADEMGVLRLRLVGRPPLENTLDAASPADPGSDSVTVALTLPHEAMVNLREVVVSGAANAITIRRR